MNKAKFIFLIILISSSLVSCTSQSASNSVVGKEPDTILLAPDNILLPEFSEKEKNEENAENAAQKAVIAYQKFLDGKIESKEGYDIDEITIPTGEPESRFPTRYAFFDSTGDGVPEFHINAARYYYVFMYQNEELVLWKDLHPYPNYHALTNGAFISWRVGAGPKHDDYCYYIFNYSGDVIFALPFMAYDKNENYVYDDEDEYTFDNVEVTKELWDKLTADYIGVDENGHEHLYNEIEWETLYEVTP